MKMMSQKEAAEYLGISWETLRKWSATKQHIPHYRYPTPTSPPRFKKEDLDRYIERSRVNMRERVKTVKLRAV